ncbi:MAG: 30S ribosomal protein S16 [Thermoflexales bacterium]|nr:30S ribosomal protein S16 [Thermoflexales bacterium]
MVRIRLRRIGAKRQPSYRIVVADSEAPRDGNFIERIGFYNPRTEPGSVEINEERALYWLNVGAQPSTSVQRLLTHCGTWERFRRLKAGEPLEALLEEARQADATKAPVDARTRLRPQTARPKPVAQAEEAATE